MMTVTAEVGSQVAMAAVLDTGWLDLDLVDDELLHDVVLWGSAGRDGATDVLAAHPKVRRLVAMAALSGRPQVRATVASRPDLDPVLYAILASDEDPAVRARLAANPAAPRAVLERLAGDGNDDVRRAATTERASRAHAAT
jgi:hypothetical protein